MCVLLMLIRDALSDLPVHCIAREAKGTWDLTASSRLRSMNSHCGHQIPDKNTDHVDSMTYLSELIEPSLLQVQLELPD